MSDDEYSSSASGGSDSEEMVFTEKEHDNLTKDLQAFLRARNKGKPKEFHNDEVCCDVVPVILMHTGWLEAKDT